jgi:type IV secretion system protein VirB3
MSARTDRTTVDPVYLALTRPAMIGGVTYAGVLVNAVVTLEAFLLTKNLLVLLLALPIHACLWLACLVEPRCFELGLAWARTSGRGWFANRRAWRANGYSPLALAARRREVTCRV